MSPVLSREVALKLWDELANLPQHVEALRTFDVIESCRRVADSQWNLMVMELNMPEDWYKPFVKGKKE